MKFKIDYSVLGAIFIAGLIILGALVYVKNNQPKLVTEGSPEESINFIITNEDHVRGNPNAQVTIVEFSDLQCPVCAKFHPVLKQILDNYPNEVRWVYKHFPLDSIHKEARSSAEASECAGEQGKFWEFTDGLFENQSKLSSAFYNKLAQEIGLNMGQFEECISSRRYKDKVESDLQEGIALGVTGTPGTFINEEFILGALPYINTRDIIKKILAK